MNTLIDRGPRFESSIRLYRASDQIPPLDVSTIELIYSDHEAKLFEVVYSELMKAGGGGIRRGLAMAEASASVNRGVGRASMIATFNTLWTEKDLGYILIQEIRNVPIINGSHSVASSRNGPTFGVLQSVESVQVHN